jgi:5'-3' exonuclease
LLRPGDATVWDAARVREKTGVGPGQIVDWLSLMGDAVDNIPGVPGVGPKTAAELLGRFGSVAGLYERLAEVKSERLRAALAAAAADVRRNQDLVRLPHAGFRLPGPASGAAPGEVRGQRTEDRGQRAEGRGQRAEDRGPTPDLGALTSDLRPLNGGLDELAVRAADVDALRGLYARWGFRGFLAALTPAGGGTDLKPVPGRDATAQATLL